ncbi:HEPN domain-containing protein [Archaeoglobus fulgidus]
MDIVPADSIYHSQQAVEKAIKAALVLKGIGQGAQSFRLILRRVRHSVPPA